jgi:hypothetical protein
MLNPLPWAIANEKGMGWRLVPVDPTEDMLDAGVKDTRPTISYAEAEEIYRAMLAAAPPALTADDVGEMQAVLQQNARLAAALAEERATFKKYACHLIGCSIHRGAHIGCNCGLVRALEQPR